MSASFLLRTPQRSAASPSCCIRAGQRSLCASPVTIKNYLSLLNGQITAYTQPSCPESRIARLAATMTAINPSQKRTESIDNPICDGETTVAPSLISGALRFVLSARIPFLREGRANHFSEASPANGPKSSGRYYSQLTTGKLN